MLFEVVEVNAALIFEFVLIFVFSLLGSFLYEAVGMIIVKSNKLSILKITASTIFTSTVMFGLNAYMYIGFRQLILPSALLGFLGFQIMLRMRTIEGFFSLVMGGINLAKEIVSLIESKIPKAEKNEEEEIETITVERKKKAK